MSYFNKKKEKNMRKLIISSLYLMVLSCSTDNTELLLPDKVSPDIYKVLFQNENVKVLEATFEPGESDNIHDHYPMTAYVQTGGKIEITLPNGTSKERTIPSGIAIHNSSKDRHQVKNIGETQIKIYLVERMATHEPYRLDLDLPELVSPNIYKVLLDNEEVKVLEVIFEPGEGDLMHEHGVITYFALNGGKMKNTLFDGTENEMKIPDNFAGHGNKVVKHKMKNIDDSLVKLILVEHKNLRLEG